MRRSEHLTARVVSIVLLLNGLVVLAQSGAHSSKLYVSVTGADSNPGTEKAPWRTIQHAADMAAAGSTVYVRGGVFEERVTINVSGNERAGFVTFRSYPGEKAILDGGNLIPEGRSGLIVRNAAQRSSFHTKRPGSSPAMILLKMLATTVLPWAGRGRGGNGSVPARGPRFPLRFRGGVYRAAWVAATLPGDRHAPPDGPGAATIVDSRVNPRSSQ